WGVNGGGAGSRSEKWIERAEGGRETLPSKIDGLDVGPGDRLVFRSAGGGGCGDPLERDPALVRFDVQTGHLTVESAGRDYGVVIAPHSSENDRRATDALRDGLRRERPHPTLFDRGDQA
ncbi:MAG: hydantoinase B/oxoprolinase family protein, partial [Pseudomonadota bacterium]